MDTALWQEWLDEQIENLQEAVIAHGVVGLLSDFEFWLKSKGYIKSEKGE